MNRFIRTFTHALAELYSARDLNRVASCVCQATRRLTGASGSAFAIRDGDACAYVMEDPEIGFWTGRRPLDADVSGWCMIHGCPAIIPEIFRDERVKGMFPESWRGRVTSVLALPVPVEEPVASIVAYWSATHEPSEDEVEVLRALADATASAMQNVELSRQIDERTASIQAVNDELETLAYAVCHDLKTPLTVMKASTWTLRQSCLDQLNERSLLCLDRLDNAVARMRDQIDAVLGLYHTTRDQMTVEDTDLSALAREICDELRASHPDHLVESRIQDGLHAPADARLLRIALENLLSNAWKYTSGRQHPRIEFGRTSTESGLAFFVRDNGVGFDLNRAEKLFGLFQRFHDDDTFQGTGIGLASVQRIINKHGGLLWAEAEVGAGAAFYFTLPELPVVASAAEDA